MADLARGVNSERVGRGELRGLLRNFQEMMAVERLNVRFEGRVQGVGFRATVCDLARGFEVTGRVRNVDDGSVELQAEGDEAELKHFLQAIEQRMARNIVHSHVAWRQVEQPQWSDFGIGFN